MTANEIKKWQKRWPDDDPQVTAVHAQLEIALQLAELNENFKRIISPWDEIAVRTYQGDK